MAQGGVLALLPALCALAFAATATLGNPTGNPYNTASAGECLDLNHTGVDYADANLTVVRGDNSPACCAACDAWNAANASSPATTCLMAVWHNTPAPGEKVCALKATADRPVPGHLVVAVRSPPPPPDPPAFRFASLYTDGMVLQAAPQRAQVWGFCAAHESGVTVDFSGHTIHANLSAAGSSDCRWHAYLPPTEFSAEPTTVTATPASNASAAITLGDVLFGDVWVCSGQSNMAYALNGSNGLALVHPPVNDSEAEVAAMRDYPLIRLFRAGEQASATPVPELAPPQQGGEHVPPVVGWSQPCPANASNSTTGCRADFSNVCWFFGRNVQAALHQRTNALRPIGLIGTYWGGTADEKWSSRDALSKCLDPKLPVPPDDGTLWNGMVVPLLNTTIRGAVWYQGEADASHPGGMYDGYNCTFPAMIADWRSKFAASSDTAPDFPFGFVQLNSIGNSDTYNSPVDPADNADGLSAAFGYAGLRWSQTHARGYVPNPAQPNVFMATSLDTPDKPFPYVGSNGVKDQGFNVHSPYKQPVGSRLARAALKQAYGQAVDTVGPLFSAVKRNGTDAVVVLQDCGSAGGVLPLRTPQGFEVLVPGSKAGEHVWASVPATGVGSDGCSVVVGGVFQAGRAATKLRYNWYSNPCGKDPFGCAVYVAVEPLVSPPLSGMESFLPLPPFVTPLPEATP